MHSVMHTVYFITYIIQKCIIQRRHFCICKKVGVRIIPVIPFCRPKSFKFKSSLMLKTHLKSKSPKKSLICWSRLPLAWTSTRSNTSLQMTFAENISYFFVNTKGLISLFESFAFLYRWSAGYVFYQLILYDII